MDTINSTRRDFLKKTAILASGLAVVQLPDMALGMSRFKSAGSDVTPVEDLMREHGVLNRILLIYDEALNRLHQNQPFNSATLNKAASLVRSFIEDYHERMEEEYVFPPLEQKGEMIGLVFNLRAQHQAGRFLTDAILATSTPAALKNPPDRKRLTDSLQTFLRMYRPHEAKEDTMIFPAFKKSLSKSEYDKLGETMEDQETKLVGKNGFETVLGEISELEKNLGIYDISKYTPK